MHYNLTMHGSLLRLTLNTGVVSSTYVHRGLIIAGIVCHAGIFGDFYWHGCDVRNSTYVHDAGWEGQGGAMAIFNFSVARGTLRPNASIY